MEGTAGFGLYLRRMTILGGERRAGELGGKKAYAKGA